MLQETCYTLQLNARNPFCDLFRSFYFHCKLQTGSLYIFFVHSVLPKRYIVSCRKIASCLTVHTRFAVETEMLYKAVFVAIRLRWIFCMSSLVKYHTYSCLLRSSVRAYSKGAFGFIGGHNTEAVYHRGPFFKAQIALTIPNVVSNKLLLL